MSFCLICNCVRCNAFQCGIGEGDCDGNEDCQNGLICEEDNCDFSDSDDCCILRPEVCTGEKDCCSVDVPVLIFFVCLFV